jgi:hypothetical protein
VKFHLKDPATEQADTANEFEVEVNPAIESATTIKQKFRTIAKLDKSATLKLYDNSGYLVNFASLVASESYTLGFIDVNKPVVSKTHQATMKVLDEINSLSKHVVALKESKIAAMVHFSSLTPRPLERQLFQSSPNLLPQNKLPRLRNPFPSKTSTQHQPMRL